MILITLRRELRVGIDAGSDSRTAKRKLSQALRRILDTIDGELDLPRITAKFLTQSNRRSVIQMGSADLHNLVEGFRLLFQRTFEINQSRQKILANRFQCGYVNGRWEDIVTRLPIFT